MALHNERGRITMISMNHITKRYGATIANDGISLTLREGEIRVLLGENGAGKTTLMNILFGLVKPDHGVIKLRNDVVDFESPRDALAHGIGMVHQHFMLVPNLTVAENVAMGTTPFWGGRFRRRDVAAAVRVAAERHRLDVPVEAIVGRLPIDIQQRVELLKLLYRGTSVLILDEPTSLLGLIQRDRLFGTLRELADEGRSIVLVTHKLAEAMEVAERITVLRRGRVERTVERANFDERLLAQAMTGRELPAAKPPDKAHVIPDTGPLLAMTDVSVKAAISEKNAVSGVTLEVRRGEIVGVGGVEGNGQEELVGALSGTIAVAGGCVAIEGVDVTSAQPRERRSRGLAVVPADRLGEGLALDLTLSENLALSAIWPRGVLRVGGFINRRALTARARDLLDEYDILPRNPHVTAAALSGGNQQKLVLARELSRQPKIVIASNPTHGLDIAATEFVHQRLFEVRARAGGVLLVSNDIDELLKLSDRVAILFGGRVAYEESTSNVSMEKLAMAMAGASDRATTVGDRND